MIELDDVCPNARERRAIRGGWGLVHWVACIPQYVPYAGLIVYGLIANALAGDFLPPLMLSGALIISALASGLSGVIVQKVIARAVARTPAGSLHCRWVLDDQGVRIGNELMSSVIDWAAIKSIREEHDRFLLLIAPMNNPVLPKRVMTADQITALKTLIADVTASGRLGRGVD